MALPPQMLRIKRKRDDDPVEALYIQTESDDSQHKRQCTEHHHIFKRLRDETGTLPSSTASMPKPSTSTTNPTDKPLQNVTNSSNPGAKLRPIAPRRFHLSRLKDAVKQNPVLGKRKEHDPEVVTFVEKRDAKKPQTTSIASSQSSQMVNGQTARVSSSTNGTMRKKRSAKTERHSGTPSQSMSSKNLVPPSQDLRQAMESYAFGQPISHGEFRDFAKDVVMTNPTTNGLDGDEDVMDIEDDGNYVYDTYVRHNVTEQSSISNTGESEHGEVGYLIISKEDDYFWQEYGSDGDESEKDWNSDQDDENAENYYGADYPEDEVDIDDEYDQDPYRYHGDPASDDEEYLSDYGIVCADNDSPHLEGWTKAY
ncbi:MAG: hypothetical protein M1831_005099 [Alyxoria varia]|nr:MAG: hypothetical protein M1831_005099 [Alyxoria varia]